MAGAQATGKIEESQVRIGGVNTFYLSGGQGQPIVFVHGIPSGSFLWRNVIAELADDFSVFAPDLPGFARSDSLPVFSLESYSDWLVNFCKSVAGEQEINLIVHDVGGPIGVAFAVQNPKLTNKLIIMDTLLSSKQLSVTMKILLSRPIFWIYYHLISKRLYKWSLRKWGVFQSDKFSDEALELYSQTFERDKKERASYKLATTLKGSIDLLVGQRLAEITSPTLFLWAEKDAFLPVSSVKQWQSEIRNSKLKTLPNCGHFCQEEEPELIATHIRDFIAHKRE